MPSFEPGAELVRLYPHAVFERLYSQGYEIWYMIQTVEQCPNMRNLSVEVRHGELIVASADFDDDSRSSHCQNVLVEAAHRRKGIAKALYVFAEKVLGKRLWNLWDGSSIQSEEAKAMWANPNRPFGDPL